MLASNPIAPDHAIRFPALQSVGAHEHLQRRAGGGLGYAVGLLGAAALLVTGYVLGGIAASGTVAPVGDGPQPVDIGGGAARVSPFPATGVVRITIPTLAQGELGLGPVNQQPIGVAAR